MAYDALGNPTTYRNKPVVWEKGRQMKSFNGLTFEYDGSGRRIKKGDVTYTYDASGNLIESSDGLTYFYGMNGVFAVKDNGTTYFYRKDAQGNIIALIDNSGKVVVEYVYDAWGNHAVLDANGNDLTNASHIGNRNPFRYRGYFYDVETGLYYLQTRYYDPEIGRFLNMDDISYADPEQLHGLNLYAYCANDPVNYVDPTGHEWWHWLLFGIATIALVAVVAASVIMTGGASLAAVGLGFGVGVASNFVGQGVSNIVNGNNFFEGIDVWSILLSGLSGAAYATGLGGIAGAFGMGVASGIADSSLKKESFANIIIDGLINGIASGVAYGVGQFFNNTIYKNGDIQFSDYMQMAKVDGAGGFKSFFTAMRASWFTFLPSMSTGVSRALINLMKKRRIFESE